MRTRNTVLLVCVLLLIGAAAAGGWLWKWVHDTARLPGAAGAVQELDVAPGASLRGALHLLQQRQLIQSARGLELYLRCCEHDPKMAAGRVQAGHYRILPGQPALDVLRQLVEGRVMLEHVTIVEGWSFAQMRAALAHAAGLQPVSKDWTDDAIMTTLGAPDLPAEGQFAPDTYSYAAGAATDVAILRMAFEAQQRLLQQAWDSRQPDLPLASPNQALALASIVEKETGLASERARVAGVYINRLRKGMRLQSDPTVIYGLGARYDGNIRKRDLTTDTPFNTYTRAGLPPTPIALPGRDAIIASLNPEKTDALFFVAIGDGSGGHYFSATVAEHNRAVQRYLERLRSQPVPEEAAAPASPAAATAGASKP